MGRLRAAVSALDLVAAHRRRGRILFASGLAVYGLQSIALPLLAGRDVGTYTRYYAQMFEWDSVLPMSMLYRTPVAPLVVGLPLDLGGGWLAQIVMGALFALSVLAWSSVAARFGPRAALLTAVALLLYPGYGILFHRLSSDSVFAASFAAWALLLIRALERPSSRRFLAAGLGVALCGLVRPGNQILLVLLVAPLLLRVSWRSRVTAAAAYAGAAVLVLGSWAILNGLRYDDYAVARAGKAYVPFFRALVRDHLVRPENGPASRELADLVQTRLLDQEPYRSYGVGLDAFFSRASDRMFEDVLNLSDQAWGWDTDYARLRDVGVEAVRAHPDRYLGGVLSDLWRELTQPLHVELPPPSSSADAAVQQAETPELPVPEGGELIPAAHQGFYSTTPDRSIREVWTSPTAHELVFAEPGARERFEATLRRMEELGASLPPYPGNATLTLWLSRSSKLFPPPALWLLVGLAALAVRRPARGALLLVPAAGALAVLLTSALGTYAIIELAVPVVPAFVALAAAALLAPGRRLRSQAP